LMSRAEANRPQNLSVGYKPPSWILLSLRNSSWPKWMKIRAWTRVFVISFAFVGIARAALAEADGGNVLHTADKAPVQGPGRVRAAYRPQVAGSLQRGNTPSPNANPWILQAKLPGAVIHDLAFPSSKIGFAAAELGQVWKTIYGGATWTEIM